jgi:transposase
MSAVLVVQDEVVSSSPGPREGGPRRRRAFSAREKLDHLTAYEAACVAGGGGGAYLREQGVYSSQITEWRKLRDAGVLSGRKPGEKIGRPSAEQAEIARLTRELDVTRRRLAKTEAALDLVGKAHALLEEFSERADTENKPRQR